MKNKPFLFFSVTTIFSVAGYVMTSSPSFGICDQIEYSCRALLNNIGDPLFYGMGALAIGFLMLVFKPEGIGSWKKFAKWYIPLATLIFIFYGNPSSGDFFSPYPEQVYQWLAGAYILISGFLILRARKY